MGQPISAFFCLLNYWKCPSENAGNGISETLTFKKTGWAPYNGATTFLNFSTRANIFKISRYLSRYAPVTSTEIDDLSY